MLLRGSKIQRVTSCNCFLKRKQPKVMVIFVHLHSVLHFLAKLQKIICHSFLSAFNQLYMNLIVHVENFVALYQSYQVYKNILPKHSRFVMIGFLQGLMMSILFSLVQSSSGDCPPVFTLSLLLTIPNQAYVLGGPSWGTRDEFIITSTMEQRSNDMSVLLLYNNK